MKAAVMRGVGQPLTIEEVDVAKPIGREVLVRVAATGVCHSDLHIIEGLYPGDFPCILGHESAGVVEEVGDQVGYFSPGDRHLLPFRVLRPLRGLRDRASRQLRAPRGREPWPW